MIRCPRWGYDNPDSVSVCVGCGYNLRGDYPRYYPQQPVSYPDNYNQYNPQNKYNNQQLQQFNPNYNPNTQQNYPQHNQQQGQYSNQQHDPSFRQQGYYQNSPNSRHMNQQQVKHKNTVFTAFLAFVCPGLGHVYLNKLRDGILVFCLCLVLDIMGLSMFMMNIFIGGIGMLGTVLIIASFCLWVYSIIDSNSKAVMNNKGKSVPDIL